MSKLKYKVWWDGIYSDVMIADDTDDDGVSFSEAKKELILYAQRNIQYHRDMLKRLKSTKISDIKP